MENLNFLILFKKMKQYLECIEITSQMFNFMYEMILFVRFWHISQIRNWLWLKNVIHYEVKTIGIQ